MNIADHKPQFEKVLDHLEKELKALRTGRATPAILDTVTVEAYGTTMDLKSVASISVPDPQTIVVEPWDTSVLKDIEKGIVAANLGLAPVVDGNKIRISLPKMTEENRKELVKALGKRAEEAKVGLRGVREEVRNEVIAAERDNKMSEDERFRMQDDLEKLVAQYSEKVTLIAADKEKEIMTI